MPVALGVLVDADDVDAEIVQLADDPRPDAAETGDDHMPAERRPGRRGRAGDARADDRGGHERQERQPVEGQQELGHTSPATARRGR